ncbi:MAG: MFS transporter [Thermodesulfobacteriota bacterium]|nr:MFS transporter [Thermodesulfobacteriota bacterium]
MATQQSKQPRFILALQYFLFFGVLGIFLPFFNLYCYHLGFSGFQIGALFSARTGATVIFPLVWGALADRFAARKAIYVLCNFMAAGIWSFFLLTTNFYLMLIITTFYGVFRAPVISFMEAFAMDILGDEKSSYGRVRAWGTISFVCIVIALGRITEVVPISLIIPLILAGTLIQSFSAIALPSVDKKQDSIGSPKSVLGRKEVVVFLICAFLMLAGHGTYYGFFSIHLENMGFGNTFIGFTWALASIAEITVMIASRRLFARFSLENVLVFSFFVACIRWIMMFFAASGVLVLLSQLLHAVTYGAFHMASILYIDRVSSDNTKTLGQALNNAVSFGLGMMLGVFVNGIFYDYVGSTPLFLGSAAISLIGGIMLWVVFRGKEKRREVI